MFFINIDVSDLINLSERLIPAAKEAMAKAGRELVPATHAHVVERANQRLHSRRQMYIDNLGIAMESPDVWLVVLNREAHWIEDGMPRHEMIDNLLKEKPGSVGKVMMAEDGSFYRVIPFKHGPGKGPASTTPAQQTLIDTLKAEFKKKGIPWGKIETDKAGKPLLGKLHELDVRFAPIKTANVPGQGKGPIGQVMQGPTGIPFLQGVRVYQKMGKDPKTGADRVQRGIVTFRVVSTKHKGTGRWVHPGLEPVKLMEEGYQWALEQWENKVAPDVVAYVLMNT